MKKAPKRRAPRPSEIDPSIAKLTELRSDELDKVAGGGATFHIKQYDA